MTHHRRMGLVESPVLSNGHAGFGRRHGETHRRKRRQGAPCRPHMFRLFKQTLGWTTPKLRTPQAADRWTWLIIAAYTQLRLARPLAVDLRRPWEQPAPPDRLTPARVRRGFRHLRTNLACPARAPKPSRPGPGRPPGRRNSQPARRYDVHLVTSGEAGKPKPKKKQSGNPRPRRTG
jgi:hypothetical protein